MENSTRNISNNSKVVVYKFSVLMFIILLNTNLLRSLKDSIIPLKVGVETLSFIRIYFEFPILCALSFIYRISIKYVPQLIIFRCVIIGYLIFISLFFLYCAYDDALQWEVRLTKFDRSVYFWPYSLFYVMCDLWPVIAYTNFYWELSNRVFVIKDAKITYPKYFIIGQSNLLISGAIIMASSVFELQIPSKETIKVNELIMCVIMGCFVIIERLYSSLSRQTRTNPSHQISNRLSFKDIWQKSFFKLMFLSIIFYYSSICIIEILCMHYLRQLYHSTTELMCVHGVSLVSLGVLTVLLSYVSKRVFCVLSISVVLKILPLFLLIVGSFGFLSLLYQIEPKYSLLMFLFSFVLGRGIKYTLYDSAKEIATIPFRVDIKRLGRLLDMLGVGGGRFIAHVLPVVLFTVFPYAHYGNISGSVIILYLTMVVLFYGVTHRLGRYTITFSG